MNKKAFKIFMCILIIVVLSATLVACNNDKLQMELMKRGYYCVVDNHNIRNKNIDVLNTEKIDWSMQVSKDMYKFLDNFKEGDPIPEKPFEVVYVIKFVSDEEAVVGKDKLVEMEATKGLLEGIDFKVKALAEIRGQFVYFGTQDALKEVMSIGM